jgi:hypothetical protein
MRRLERRQLGDLCRGPIHGHFGWFSPVIRTKRSQLSRGRRDEVNPLVRPDIGLSGVRAERRVRNQEILSSGLELGRRRSSVAVGEGGYCEGPGFWFVSGRAGESDTRIPAASKTYVFTSASAPWAGISWPFHTKLMPAALPILTTISRVARMEVWAGAINVSCVTV